MGSVRLFSILKRKGFPEGYQTLCHNCNLAKGFYGQCPHEQERAAQRLLVLVHEVR